MEEIRRPEAEEDSGGGNLTLKRGGVALVEVLLPCNTAILLSKGTVDSSGPHCLARN